MPTPYRERGRIDTPKAKTIKEGINAKLGYNLTVNI